jgi:hypothetical protein
MEEEDTGGGAGPGHSHLAAAAARGGTAGLDATLYTLCDEVTAVE